MMELQHILHDIARKGSETPFERHPIDPYRKSIRNKRARVVSSEPSHVVQLSLFQNR